MDAIIHSRKRCGVASACRLIRGRWDPEERRQRRQMAKAMQQELWQLLTAGRSVPAKGEAGKPAFASGVHVDRLLSSTGALCFPS